MTDLLLSSVQNVLKTMICWFLMAKLRPEIESLRKTCSKTALLIILVSLMMIDTTTAFTDEGGMYNKDDIPVMVFS